MKEIEQQIAKYVNGELNEIESARLLEKCQQDPELLDKISELVETERMLSIIDSDLDKMHEETMLHLSEQTPDFSNKIISTLEKERFKRRTMFVFTAVSAAAIMLLWVFFPQVKTAQITASLDADWKYQLYQKISNGKYKLNKGFVELNFISGAKLLIEGPSEFTINSPMNIELTSGKVVADIPPSAHGFTVNTPTSKTIDLGTRFAVKADSKSSEIHVIDGLVKSRGKQSDSYIELRKNEALKIDSDFEEKKLEADFGQFLTALPPDKVSDPKFILWKFDENEGDISKPLSHGYETKYMAHLKSIKDTLPERVPGKYGNALKFDGESNFVDTDFPGIGGDKARTVSFWMKTAPDYKDINGYAMISWGSFEYYGATWQISLNPESQQGPLGRLRCGTHRGQIIGNRDLRDNNWHHITVVLYGGPEADVSTHILIYVDGELEHAARKSVRLIDTDITSKGAIKMQIAQNASFKHNKKVKYKFFKGIIDEVYVFNFALSSAEVRKVMKNQLISSKPK